MEEISHKDSKTRTIYIELLDEGTRVYRPTQAIPLKESLYKILATDNYDPEDECWKFKPGSIVEAEFEFLGEPKEKVLIAKKEHES